MSDEIVIFVTTNSTEEAQQIGNKLVESKLVACVNIVSSVQSIFRWKGELCEEGETLMILKSVRKNIEEIITKVKSLHSYEVPEIIALPIIAGSKEYLNWVHEETQE
ncbi:MAG: divalent-cation tolerance protein CutA [bacterium]